MKIFGMVAPFGVLETHPTGVLHRYIEQGAFDQEALSSGHLCEFRINHRRPALDGASIKFVNGHGGLYAFVTLQSCAATRAIERQPWRGMSIAYLPSDTSSSVDWRSNARVITRIGFVSEISLVTGDHRPAFPTWAMEFGQAALARMKRENVEALADRWRGLDLSALPPAWTALPIQSREQEATLQRLDPLRRFNAGGMPYGISFGI